ISQEVPKVLIGDPLRLKQMIFNLVSNALKFTEEGHVAVHCKLVSRKEESALLAFQVKDTGIGIPEDRLKTIFDEFVQADSSTTRKYGGTGLGLSITKKLAEMHGGYVDMKSEVGKGTEITLYIPYTPGSDKDLEIMAPEREITFDLLKGKRALVADDEPYNRMLIETIMERWGVEIFVAENGRKALDFIEEGNQFDFILMDLQMPEVDGFEAVRQIREVHNLNLPILALTATATEQEITKTLEIGMNGHLLKPFKERELYALLLNLLNVENKQDIETEIKELEEALSPENDDLITEEEENMATYNFDELYRLANKNKDFMINMLNIFVNNTHKNLSAMVAGMEKEDWDEVSMRAHKIIPPSRHLGLGMIVNQLKSIELDAMNKTNIENLPAAVKKVASEIEETIESIQKDIKNMS
ncbi:MAG: response regulator, partial [Bacteroidetes bacterium]|nr:response regulator [Bacteroidota bacterium]